ncbi:PAS domain-containing sensor histidine kinase [Marinomonas rhizomae]|uniref:histidine kinase n=1 Tax=Marinomonas rhizomae TaxID=491948 RepID=A0A366J6F9_9GAMM|nr:PAS domain-containing hybrid sensor histidine kinase/response regulator [Marinomonas rhizomae]RBP82566.1 PAS domain S-box-containing protein [Marinomonas rhizomae]RNF73649.1 PAS domain-containing sensor histidine kinase [Marinomonas rhizomae]
MDIELPILLKIFAGLFAFTAFLLLALQLAFLFRFKLLQRRYSRAILATGAGVWEWFPETGRLYASSEFFMQLGFEEQKTPKSLNDWLAFLSPEDQIAFNTWRTVLLKQGPHLVSKSVRVKLTNHLKECFWVEMRGNVTRRDAHQRVLSVAGIFEDIGHLVETENALIAAREESRRRELTLSSLLNNIPDLVWSKDEQGNYLDCNQAFLDFNQLTAQSIKGKNDLDLNLDGKGAYYQNAGDIPLQTGITSHEQGWGCPKDGSESRLFEVYRVPVIEPSINFRGTLGIARDITERHQLFNQLKLFKRFADNSAQGFAMASLDGDISYFNKKIRSMLGVDESASDESLSKFNYMEFYPEASQKFLKETVIPYVREHGVWEGELEVKSLDGRIFTTYETYFLMLDENGKAISVGDIMSDITEQKNVSMQLEQAKEEAEQANQAKSHFLANMSHEIRTPLNAIIGYAQLISEDNQLTGLSKTRFLSIASAGHRLLGLINDILDIARIESGRLVLHEQKTNLCREVKQISKLFQGQAQEKGLDLIVECDIDERQIVLIDPVKFQQIITNLLGNAVKFTVQGYVKAVVQIVEDRIHVSIEDTGPGIETELMDHLFTPFVQGKAGEASGGTGLGLSLSTTLVKLMGGTLTVNSSEGLGTQIVVDLPLSKVNNSETIDCDEQDTLLNMRLNNPIRVLVAEDDEWSRDILVSLLEKAGCQIIEAEDGEQAIKAFKNNPPDLVMTDIRMPNKTGIDLLKFIQQEDTEQRIPVVAVTASTLIHEQQSLLDDGFWQVIAKPYRIEDIYKALVAHLDVKFVPIIESTEAQKDTDEQVEEDVQNVDSVDLLCDIAPEDWRPLLLAAQSGDVQTTEEVFNLLRKSLSTNQQKTLQAAISQFDLGLVETLIAQYSGQQESV